MKLALPAILRSFTVSLASFHAPGAFQPNMGLVPTRGDLEAL